MTIQARHDPEQKRFAAALNGGQEAVLEYAPAGAKTLEYKSTFVPEQEREQGIGEELVLYALDYARDNDYRVIPTCPFVRHVVDEHPEYGELMTTR